MDLAFRSSDISHVGNTCWPSITVAKKTQFACKLQGKQEQEGQHWRRRTSSKPGVVFLPDIIRHYLSRSRESVRSAAPVVMPTSLNTSAPLVHCAHSPITKEMISLK